MARTIYKYPLALTDDIQIIIMPGGAEILHVGVQGENLVPRICLWAYIDPGAETQPRTFRVFGTGHDLPTKHEYVGTVQMGSYVWHIFEVEA